MMKRLATTLILTSAIALAACSKKAPEMLPPDPVDQSASTNQQSQQQQVQQPAGPQPGSQGHFLQVMNGRDTIYFDTDMFNIDAKDQQDLRAQAQYLLNNPNAQAMIEGHCDERGTRDYNLALGERRANAAKNYLVSLGVPATRLRVISYGKERPKALGSNEAAWAQNRRAATVTII